ncbi:MAG: alpha/beta hydrolase [Humibacillus sp.]|nr:alpha/beta hydrolase [Humibacillus sp.]MDN5776341.1 alpha/beta hydrolase [Humibacillus sp.]
MSPPRSVGGLEASFVSNGSSRLAVRQWDAGGTPILALHPGVADSRVWQECARVWADAGHRVVAYDRRGFGSTTWEEEPHDPLCDLRAVTAATGSRPAVVVGNSKGGALGLELALAHPEEVLALVVIGSVPDDTPDDLWVLAPTEDERDAEAAAAAASGDLDLVNRLDLRYWLDGIGQPEGRVTGVPRELLAEMNGTALRAISTGAVTATRPVWPVLESLAVPTFLVVGEYDLPGFAVVAAAIAERVSDAQVVILQGTAHLPPLDAPAAVAALVLDVVAGVSMSPPHGVRDTGPDHTPALP